MKKTISTSLGGFNYQIEEDAYERLEKYLTEVKAHFASFPDAAEIVSDMEARMAEQFETKTGDNKIVTLPIVEELIGIMGSPEQFSDDKTGAPKAEAADSGDKPQKRLFRNPDDAILAGVCSGISVYLGVSDPLWVRLVFVVSIFFGGFGVLLYLILWIITPAAKTDTEKMQMRGEPINLKNLEATVKERVDEIKNRDPEKTKKSLRAPLRTLAVVLTALGKFFIQLFFILIKIIGLVLIISAALLMAGIVLAIVSILFNFNSPYIDFPVREVLTGASFYAAVISAFFVLFVPVVFLIELGSSLFANKSTFTKMGALSLFIVWVVAISVFANIGIRYAPQIKDTIENSPYYQTQTKNFEITDFRTVELNSAYEATIIKSDEFKIVATGSQKEMGEIKVYKKNDTLVAERDNSLWICLFCFHGAAKLQIFMPELDGVNLSGASKITTEGFSSQEFNLKLSGASRASLDITTPRLIVNLSGASKTELKGKIEEARIELSGASQARFSEAEVGKADLDLSGASTAYFKHLESLIVRASGASKVYYESVKDIQTNLSGASRVLQTNGN